MGNLTNAQDSTCINSEAKKPTIADNEQQNAGASQCPGKDKSPNEDSPLSQVPIYLINEGKGIIEALNVPARNEVVRKSPALVKHVVAEALQRQANKEGLYEDADCVVHWKPSAIPFHVEFEIIVLNDTCKHLVSVRSIKAKDRHQYAKNLVPLAKVFLSKPSGSHLPHLPFVRSQTTSKNHSNGNAENKQTTDTIQHARLINEQHNSLTEIDIHTAEATARMISAGKIFFSLLIYLTTPRPRVEADSGSKQPLSIGKKGVQSTERPFSAAPERPKGVSSADQTQDLRAVLKQKAIGSPSEDSVDGMMVTENTTMREKGAAEPALGEKVPEETATAMRPSKTAKAVKKNERSGKQVLNQRNNMGATFPISAYPTQRPPRRKYAKKTILTRTTSKARELAPGECDLGQRTTARSQLEMFGYEEKSLEQRVNPGESLPINRTSPESISEEHRESEGRTKEALVTSERATDVGLPSNDTVHNHALPEFVLEEHEEHEPPTAGEFFNPEHIVTDVGSLPSHTVHECASLRSAPEDYKESEAHTADGLSESEQTMTDIGFPSSDSVRSGETLTTASKLITLSLLTKPTYGYGSGVQGLLWAFRVNSGVDEVLKDAGVWLWEKPETFFHSQAIQRMMFSGHSFLAPIIVSHQTTWDDKPIIEFDENTIRIVPHKQCWEDVRSNEDHPDFLVPWKLAEYQASEAFGYQIWRHDRDLLECRMLNCNTLVSDYHHSTVVCLGCGPKSLVRYCSLQHQMEDVEEHFKECGTWRVLLQLVIDHATAPSRFALMCPAIKQRHGSRTAALHRQVLYCALSYGHYTLFDPTSNRFETLCWSKEDPKWPEMDRRVERLLNIAFLDSWNHYILGYLFRLLRELLRSRGQWYMSTERHLKQQFEAEFSHYKVNTLWRDGVPPCQCEWTGKVLPRYNHLSTCFEYSPVAYDYGAVWRQNFIEATVTTYEERFWILRAWRQQHPTQNNWRLRAAGYGFANVIPDEGCYELGPGWTGWGGERDNVCEGDGYQGEGSMRSA